MAIPAKSVALLLPAGMSLVAFGSFAWGLRGHFETHGRIPPRMKLLSVASLAAYLLFVGLLLHEGGAAACRGTIGTTGFAASAILFWLAILNTRHPRPAVAYVDSRPEVIYTHGPYAYVRHPFYVSYILFWIDTAVIVGGWQWVPALILSAWYIRLAQREEWRLLASPLAAHYIAYSKSTGMLLPRHLPGLPRAGTAGPR